MTKNSNFCLLGHFGGHFERRPLLKISRILKICYTYIILLFTVFAYKTSIRTSKLPHFNVLIMTKMAIFAYLGHLVAILKGTLYSESSEFCNMLHAFYCFRIQKWYSNLKKHFFLIYIVQIIPKKAHLVHLRDILTAILKGTLYWESAEFLNFARRYCLVLIKIHFTYFCK